MAVSVPAIIQYIGLVCSSIVIIILLILVLIDINYVNRVTVRLVVGIAIADFLSHIAAILTLSSQPYIGTPYCQGLAAVSSIGRLLYSLTNIAICFHLHRAIVQLKKSSFKYELIVWICIMSIIGAIMIAYHFFGVFSGTLNKHNCNPGADNYNVTRFVGGLVGSLNLIAIFSGVYITYVGHKYIKHWINSYSDRQMGNDVSKNNFKSKKHKIAQRSFLYPLSTIITLSVEMVLGLWTAFSRPPLIMFTLNGYTSGLKGILTLITFIIDPALWSSIESAYIKLTGTRSGAKTASEEVIEELPK